MPFLLPASTSCAAKAAATFWLVRGTVRWAPARRMDRCGGGVAQARQCGQTTAEHSSHPLSHPATVMCLASGLVHRTLLYVCTPLVDYGTMIALCRCSRLWTLLTLAQPSNRPASSRERPGRDPNGNARTCRSVREPPCRAVQARQAWCLGRRRMRWNYQSVPRVPTRGQARGRPCVDAR